jgi:hypothetical protein
MSGFVLALAFSFATLEVDVSMAQDQPIKRTELLRADVADVPGKESRH